MPIIGLTDRPAAFPRIGELRKGSTKREKTAKDGRVYSVYGSDLRGFRFTTQDAEAAQRFKDAYGDEPQRVQLYLPYPSVDENFIAWREHWEHGGLLHRCDGEMMVRWRRDDGSYSAEPRPCPKDGKCKQVGRLCVILPVLQRFAYVTVMTSSIHDIIELSENLKAMVALRGSLQGVPMVLSRKPREISVPSDDGKRRRMEKWLLSIEADPGWVAVQLMAMERQALGLAAPTARPALMDTQHGAVDVATGELFDEPEEDAEVEYSEPELVEPVNVPEDAISIRRREREEHARKVAELSQVRKALRANGGIPRKMTENEAAEMTIADLQREIDETTALLQPAAA